MNKLQLTGSQTVGPFFAPCLLREGALRQVLITAATAGEPIRLEGQVLDGDGEPVPDAMVEIWQADASGHYHDPNTHHDFIGYGRSDTANGSYWFETIKPGAVAFAAESRQAPHILMTIFARGLLNHLVTRVYFEDEPGNATDPVLALVPAARRFSLLAHRQQAGKIVYRFDVVLQGQNETAFFNV